MASRGSYIRSAARATFSAYRRDPDPLAAGRRLGDADLRDPGVVRGDRRGAHRPGSCAASSTTRCAATPTSWRRDLHLKWLGDGAYLNCKKQNVSLKDYTSAEHAQIRIFNEAGVLLCTQKDVKVKGVKALPATPELPAPAKAGTYDEGGYLVVAQQLSVPPSTVWLLYARPLSDVDHTVARVRVILLLGVLGGTVLALLGGLATAARAMRPIVQLTEASREIERTRDPTLRLPQPEADDEVAELTRTVEGMLLSLDCRAQRHPRRARAPTGVRRRRLARAAHATDQPAREPRAAGRGARRRAGRHRRGRAAFRPADAPARRRPAAARARRRPPNRVARSDRPRRRAARGGLRARADGRGPRALDRGPAGGRARRARRPPSPDAEPDRERGPSHACPARTSARPPRCRTAWRF